MSLPCFFRRSFHHLLTLSSTPPLWAGKLAALLTNHSIVFISITLPNLTFWLSPFITPILFISLTLLDPRSLPLVHQGSSGIHWGQSYSYKLEEMSTRHWFNNHLLKYSYISLPYMLPTHPDATLSEKLMMMKDSSAHRLHRPYQRISWQLVIS